MLTTDTQHFNMLEMFSATHGATGYIQPTTVL